MYIEQGSVQQCAENNVRTRSSLNGEWPLGLSRHLIMNRLRPILALILLLFFAYESKAQWVVADQSTSEPLPFAHIIIGSGPKGAVADMNGRFALPLGTADSIRVGHLGYRTRVLWVNSFDPDTIFLTRVNNLLASVTVTPKADPAYALMRKVYEAREKNDPLEIEAFSCTGYDKFRFIAVPDSTKLRRTGHDSLMTRVHGTMERHGLMLTENITHRHYRSGIWADTVMATRISGLRNSELPVLATELQSFSFYRSTFRVADETFSTPIMRLAGRVFRLQLSDTLVVDKDTVYVVGFSPWSGKGMSGTLHINAADLAIRNVSAGVVTAIGPVHIRQEYTRLPSGRWFPKRLNTDGTFTLLSTNGLFIGMSGITAIDDVRIIDRAEAPRPGIRPLEVGRRALRRDSTFWADARSEPLTAWEQRTYRTIDSLGRKAKLDARMRLLTAAASGMLPLGPIDLDLASIVDYNRYEGIRLGAGLYTHPRLLRGTTLGGHVAYGFSDKAVKYGGRADVLLHRGTDLHLRLSYMHDLQESGSVRNMPDAPLGLRNLYRTINLQMYDMVDEARADLLLRPARGLRLRIGVAHTKSTAKGGQAFVPVAGDTISTATLFEANLGVRWSFKERLYSIDSRSMAQDGPFWAEAHLSKGIRGVVGSGYDYWRISAQAHASYRIRVLGKGSIRLRADWVSTAVPYIRMFTPRANFDDLSLYSPFSFETVRMNEFLHRWQLSVHHLHSFGRWASPLQWLVPEFILVNNIGLGGNPTPAHHTGTSVSTMRSGHFESGLVIEDLIRIKVIGIGGGAFLRYGPTALKEFDQNLTYKLSMRLAL